MTNDKLTLPGSTPDVQTRSDHVLFERQMFLLVYESRGRRQVYVCWTDLSMGPYLMTRFNIPSQTNINVNTRRSVLKLEDCYTALFHVYMKRLNAMI